MKLIFQLENEDLFDVECHDKKKPKLNYDFTFQCPLNFKTIEQLRIFPNSENRLFVREPPIFDTLRLERGCYFLKKEDFEIEYNIIKKYYSFKLKNFPPREWKNVCVIMYKPIGTSQEYLNQLYTIDVFGKIQYYFRESHWELTKKNPEKSLISPVIEGKHTWIKMYGYEMKKSISEIPLSEIMSKEPQTLIRFEKESTFPKNFITKKMMWNILKHNWRIINPKFQIYPDAWKMKNIHTLFAYSQNFQNKLLLKFKKIEPQMNKKVPVIINKQINAEHEILRSALRSTDGTKIRYIRTLFEYKSGNLGENVALQFKKIEEDFNQSFDTADFNESFDTAESENLKNYEKESKEKIDLTTLKSRDGSRYIYIYHSNHYDCDNSLEKIIRENNIDAVIDKSESELLSDVNVAKKNIAEVQNIVFRAQQKHILTILTDIENDTNLLSGRGNEYEITNYLKLSFRPFRDFFHEVYLNFCNYGVVRGILSAIENGNKNILVVIGSASHSKGIIQILEFGYKEIFKIHKEHGKFEINLNALNFEDLFLNEEL